MISGESLLKSIDERKLPPVESWNPPYCGELDIHIKADGSWFYQGTPIARRRLQILFSRIIKKEAEQYFLVTPHEKVAIRVDWRPFTIIDFTLNGKTEKPSIECLDNCNNRIMLTHSAQLKLEVFQGQLLPIVQVRGNLFASFSRACYYRLVSEATIVKQHDSRQVQIFSNGIPFNLGEYTDDD